MNEVQLLCSCPNLDITTFSLECLEFVLYLWAGPITHICTPEKGESDSTVKFKILQLFYLSSDNLTSVFF